MLDLHCLDFKLNFQYNLPEIVNINTIDKINKIIIKLLFRLKFKVASVYLNILLGYLFLLNDIEVCYELC